MRPTLILGLLTVGALAGCLAPTSTTTTTGSAALALANYHAPPVPKVDVKALLDDHDAFVRKDNERADDVPTHEQARVDLLAHFKSYGLEPYRFNFTMGGLKQADVLGIKWGVDRTHWVFVGGHYDTTDQICALTGIGGRTPSLPGSSNCPIRHLSQGAYDDGSGTFLTVHLAKAFANVSTYYTVAFTGYDGEERGTQGARAIVQAVTEGNLTVDGVTPAVVGDLDLDMVGINWPGTNAPLNVLTNSEALYKATDAFRASIGMPADQMIRKQALMLGSSDYAQFWHVKQPAPIPTIFFISDFEELGTPAPAPEQAHTPTPAGYYPFWHLEDTVETMRLMAGDPPADGVPHPNLEAGFGTAASLSATLIHLMACQPGTTLDAKVI